MDTKNDDKAFRRIGMSKPTELWLRKSKNRAPNGWLCESIEPKTGAHDVLHVIDYEAYAVLKEEYDAQVILKIEAIGKYGLSEVENGRLKAALKKIISDDELTWEQYPQSKGIYSHYADIAIEALKNTEQG